MAAFANGCILYGAPSHLILLIHIPISVSYCFLLNFYLQGPARITIAVPNVDDGSLKGQTLEIMVQSLSEIE